MSQAILLIVCIFFITTNVNALSSRCYKFKTAFYVLLSEVQRLEKEVYSIKICLEKEAYSIKVCPISTCYSSNKNTSVNVPKLHPQGVQSLIFKLIVGYSIRSVSICNL